MINIVDELPNTLSLINSDNVNIINKILTQDSKCYNYGYECLNFMNCTKIYDPITVNQYDILTINFKLPQNLFKVKNEKQGSTLCDIINKIIINLNILSPIVKINEQINFNLKEESTEIKIENKDCYYDITFLYIFNQTIEKLYKVEYDVTLQFSHLKLAQ